MQVRWRHSLHFSPGSRVLLRALKGCMSKEVLSELRPPGFDPRAGGRAARRLTRLAHSHASPGATSTGASARGWVDLRLRVRAHGSVGAMAACYGALRGRPAMKARAPCSGWLASITATLWRRVSTTTPDPAHSASGFV